MELESLDIQCSNASKPIILVVDDDEDSLLLLTQALELSNKSTVAAIDGEMALALARTFNPNLILLDIILPDINGFEVLRRLKLNPKTTNIPVVAVTALAKLEDREQLLRSGCHACLSKPYLLDDLEQVVDRLLNSASLNCVIPVS